MKKPPIIKARRLKLKSEILSKILPKERNGFQAALISLKVISLIDIELYIH
jgi:hypothetical protein